jgi:dephospho-CoA kinase
VSPLLLETNQKDFCNKVLVVDVPVELQMERTLKRDGVSEEQVKSIIKAQISRDDRLELADEVIINDGSLEDLQSEVKELHERIISEI